MNKDQKVHIKKRIATVSDFKNVFRSEEGQRVLYNILKRGNILSVSHNPGLPQETAFQEGRRDMALYILSKIKTDEKQLIEILDKGETNERDSYDI